ncbi:type II toxin-antitoxin system RelE/ParE family toxin [uncultured Rhodospira sp.]|uniref:type II toxin-antitoxin system RelE family toxin n=1 Tax=uncultured Rhodospira sp. TaxID=1936189 RepID=UPI0026232D7F|nr:type II toxin-antitoxin system RelE/ParE family toxin [uncultured Rhodospira sp.]
MDIQFSERAVKELSRLRPPSLQDRVVAKIKQYAVDPVSLGHQVKALAGREGYRLRVGDIRVIFTLTGEAPHRVMSISNVRHRRDAYD